MDFRQAEERFRALEDQRTRGVLTPEQYRNALNRLRVTDAQGRTWMLQERTGQWHVYQDAQWFAAKPPAQPPSAAPGPPAASSAVPPKRAKKPRGCVRSCLIVGGLLSLLACVVAAGVLLVPMLFPRESDNISLGKREPVTSGKVPVSGGTVVVEEPGSPIDGLTIEVPEGAYEEKQDFKISVRPVEGHAFGPDFNPATPLIHVDNGGAPAAEPVKVRIPVQVAPDEFAMAFYYDPRTGSLEGLPLAELGEDHVTVVTSHFSDLLASTIPWELLEDVTVDTGFEPGYDDWQFTNLGSTIAPGGHCAGQSITAMWYYYEKKLGEGERVLYGRYDNNDHGYGTIDFQWDDSWGYRFASVVQSELIDWDHLSRSFFKSMGGTGDHLTWNAFAYAMKLTGEPQYAAIYSEDGGHAIVAYKIEDGQIHVADPSYPGTAGRVLRYEEGAFLPYFSGPNAEEIAEEGERAYSAIRYMAKSAMVDWKGIGDEYEKLLDGEAGNGVFPDYDLKYLSGVDEVTGEYIYSPLPETLELSEEDTAAPGEAFRGKLRLLVSLPSREFQAFLYEGTDEVEGYLSDGINEVHLEMDLNTGSHDLGILVETIHNTRRGRRPRFMDFQRFTVLYGREDLSGVWEGTWQVEDARGVLQYVEDVLVKIILWTGLTDSEVEAREAAQAGIEQDPELYAPRPMRMEIEAIDPEKGDKYTIRVHLDDSGAIHEGEATYRDGVFTFSARSDDASRSAFTGQLAGEGLLSGTFSTTAWGVIKDALTGSWELERVP